MLRNLSNRKGLSLALTAAFILTFVLPLSARDDRLERRLMFLGVKSENLPSTVREDIQERILRIFRGNKQLQVVDTPTISPDHAAMNVQDLLQTGDLRKMRSLALANDLDHFFWAEIQGRKDERGALQLKGTFFRFDPHTQKLNQYNFNAPYGRIGNELVAFKAKFIDPVTRPKGGLNLKSALAIAALAAISIIVFSQNRAGSSGGKKDRTGPVDE
ncbi:MAG: hypothetical protein D6743_09805 [Calditrichaeota bacterium]|nr:MAG: hypothetical protein D6743_09805 [Calditrichota bacterium]